MRKNIWVIALVGVLFFGTTAHAATYNVDTMHTTVGFKVRHLFSNVVGHFKQFKGTMEYEPGKPETWKAEGTIDAASIDTNVEKRDTHLKSADFFDVEKYPTVTFKTVKTTASTDTTAKVEGLMSLHGVEKPVVFDVEINGVGKDPWGNTRLGLTAKTKIDRKDFGLTWNQTLETGGVLVGDEVEITLEVEGILAP